jgi:hypothetical protein
MKPKLLLTILLSFSFYLLSSQIPQGFNYQAIARDGSGNPLAGQNLQVEISIQSDTSAAPNVIWKEQFNTVKTNAFGLFTVVIGKGVRQSGTALFFDSIQWAAAPAFINTQIYYGGSWKNMGQSKLWSVPYAMVSGDLAGPLKKLAVTGVATSPDSALFEVKNKNGQTVFAVYNEGVRVYVSDGIAKGASKGGFAIGGFSSAKAGTQDLFVVSSDSIRAYIGTNPAKGVKGGFAIGGFSAAKAPGEEYMRVTRDSTRVYVRQPVKGQKGGFAIGGFSAAKATASNFLDLTPQNYFIGQDAGKSITTGLYNTFLGYQNGYTNTSGSQNIFLGYKAGFLNDTSSYNIFIGNEAGYNNIRGSYNTFIGYQTGQMNTTGGGNVFMGQQAGNKNTTGGSNVFLGYLSGQNKTAGSRNIFMGSLSGSNSTSGNDNLFLGTAAGYKTAADFNIFIGSYSGAFNVTGANNIFAGQLSGYKNRRGSSNIYFGLTAGLNDTIGNWNVFMGEGAGFSTQGSNDLMFGYQSGYSSTGGDWNIFMGTQTGAHNSGDKNLFFGYQSGWTNTTGSANVFMGPLSGGYNSSGSDNVYIGNEAGFTGASGSRNIAIGTQTGYKTNGISNIFLGYQSGYNNTTGMQNVFFGTQAGVGNTIGYNNIFMGVVAGQYNIDGASNVFIGTSAGNKNTSGNYNTTIGNLAGSSNQTGSANVFIGNQAGYNELGSNKLYIENTAADLNSALIYGDFGANYLKLNALVEVSGNVSIGKTTPLTKLDIEGGNYNVVGASMGDFRIGSGIYSFNIGLANGGGGAGDVRLTAKGGTNRLILGGGGVDILQINSAGIYPWTDNATSFGAPTLRWSAVYAVNGTIQTSDARLKTNISELGYGLDAILKLQPVSFTWKDDSKNILRLGLIAQDVDKVISEVVDKGNDPAQTLGINYSELVPVLIKGMQEQQKQIEELKTLVNQLIGNQSGSVNK